MTCKSVCSVHAAWYLQRVIHIGRTVHCRRGEGHMGSSQATATAHTKIHIFEEANRTRPTSGACKEFLRTRGGRQRGYKPYASRVSNSAKRARREVCRLKVSLMDQTRKSMIKAVWEHNGYGFVRAATRISASQKREIHASTTGVGAIAGQG